MVCSRVVVVAGTEWSPHPDTCTLVLQKVPSELHPATTAFTFKTLLRHYAKRALTPRSLNVKLAVSLVGAFFVIKTLWMKLFEALMHTV